MNLVKLYISSIVLVLAGILLARYVILGARYLLTTVLGFAVPDSIFAFALVLCGIGVMVGVLKHNSKKLDPNGSRSAGPS